MKAVVYTKYGSPEVLHLAEVEKPVPKDDEVLLKIQASSVNWADWHNLRADPFLVRLMAGLFKPKDTILGIDAAGEVEAVGRNVTDFQPGDALFGGLYENGLGGFAEYVAAPANSLAPKPANLTFEEAAAVPAAALTALQGLRDQGQIQPGQKVLVNGASGGIGTFAVQIAKALGAEVTAVCSTRNVGMVRALGADQVIDYTEEDCSQNGQRYDLILDNVGDPEMYKRLHQRSLTPKGICVVVAGSFYLRFILGPWLSRNGNNQIGTFMSDGGKKADLLFMKELIEAGKVKPVIDRCYPLSAVPEAVRYLEAGHARGKVIISVTQDNNN